MTEPQFRYNPKTLRDERVQFSIWRTAGAFIAYSCFGILFFIGLNLFQNFVIETKLEKALVTENKSLSEYKVVLASQVETSNQLLSGLKVDESKLHGKLFEAPVEQESQIIVHSAEKVAVTEDWSESMNQLNDRLRAVHQKTKIKNQF